MLFRSCALSAAMILLSFHAIAGTVEIDYTLSNLGSGVYRYNYSVDNNGSLGAGVAVDLFDINFDPSLYQSPVIVPPTPPSQWSEMILDSVGSAIPVAFDVEGTSGGIPVGDTANGFAVTFTWLGKGLPGSQGFEIYDPVSFALLQSGQTDPVPEPSTFGMLGILMAYSALRVFPKRA